MINIYKASAGSGKTFTLAREYIKLILGHKDEEGRYVLNRPGSRPGHKAVLAMTFTNKATEEMKSRIIHELAVLAGCEKDWDEPSPYEKDLCATFGCDAARLAVAAKDALLGLLYDFSRFSISTIDSFFQTVLRSFAHEAEVSSNYALELDDEEVITMSVDRLLQSLNHGRPTKQSHEIETWITGYMKSLIEDGSQFTLFNRNGNVQSDLIKFIAKIHNDTFKDNEKRVMDYLNDDSKFHSFCDTVFTRMRRIKADTAAICARGKKTIEDSKKNKLFNKNVINILEDWSSKGWKKYANSILPKTIGNVLDDPQQMWTADTCKKGQTDSMLEAAVSEAMRSIVNCHNSVTILNVIKENLYQLGLLSSIMELVDHFRRENVTLLLSDTNSLLAKIIGDEDSPFLYEKLGVRFQHYLIDEFQDTSLSQWANMRPLLRESLAYDYDNLVIGDEKQCIYRFRNSDPSLLHNLHAEPWAEGRTIVRGDSVSENTNWRSSADVVRFNNSLFTSIARQWGFEDVYSNVEQQVSSKHVDHRGYVLLSCFDASKEPEEEALGQMAREMRRQLESGYAPGDIAILVRQVRDGEKVIRYLEELRKADPTYPKFDIISDKSLLISHSDAVTNVISRLRMLSSVDVTTDPRRKSTREVARIINDYETAFTSGMSPDKALQQAIDMMSKRAAEEDGQNTNLEDASLHGVDLISLVESVINTHVDQRLRESDSVYIAAFMDLLTKFVSQGKADIRSFLQWWDDTGSNMSIAGGSDSRALNILTVHKSKGLEFHCVHIPFGEFTTSGRGDTAWFELPAIEGIPEDIIPPMMPLTISKALSSTPLAEQYEEIKRERVLDQSNLLYVAFTRAVDELIVGVKLSKSVRTEALATGEIPSVARTIYEGVKGAGTSPQLPLAFDADMRLTVGEPTVKKAEKKAKGTAMRPSTSVRMPAYEATSTDSVWENTNVDTDRLNRIQVARERGLILHALMSRIRHRNDIDRAVILLKASPDSRTLTEDDYVALREVVETRVNDPKATEWFDGYKKAYLEREILTADGRLLRVDRVVWTASGELHVIDYKTGSQDPRRYTKQIKDYMQFFRSIGYPQVQGYLYYLDSGEIIEVS